MSPSTRKIGDHEFSAIGFGAMGISSFYGSYGTDEERLKVLDRAYELNCRHWDTANIYGDSERLIGKWLKRTGKRNDIFLATKFGFTEQYSIRGDPQYVRECAENSLKSLGVDYVDLLYVHRIDPNTPIEETVGAIVKLIEEGKVKYIGLSECSSQALRRAHAVHPIAAVQFEYSPFTLYIEDPRIGLLETARELGIKVVAYSPLGRGLLTGQYKSLDVFEKQDLRQTMPKFKENFPNILSLAEELKSIGSKRGATAAQVALAWVLAQGDDIIPIPGTKTVKYLEENIAASEIKLNPTEIQAVRQAYEKAKLSNAARYGPGVMEQVLLDSPPLRG